MEMLDSEKRAQFLSHATLLSAFLAMGKPHATDREISTATVIFQHIRQDRLEWNINPYIQRVIDYSFEVYQNFVSPLIQDSDFLHVSPTEFRELIVTFFLMGQDSGSNTIFFSNEVIDALEQMGKVDFTGDSTGQYRSGLQAFVNTVVGFGAAEQLSHRRVQMADLVQTDINETIINAERMMQDTQE